MRKYLASVILNIQLSVPRKQNPNNRKKKKKTTQMIWNRCEIGLRDIHCFHICVIKLIAAIVHSWQNECTKRAKKEHHKTLIKNPFRIKALVRPVYNMYVYSIKNDICIVSNGCKWQEQICQHPIKFAKIET